MTIVRSFARDPRHLPPQESALQTFSPREVQARVRAGEFAEAIAADTGWPLDKVTRYAEPLLAERAFIAQQAQAVEVRRSGGTVTLRETANAATGDVDITWDAFRREDGRWVVTATYQHQATSRRAAWTYDHVGRNVHPQDDDARALMGARPSASGSSDLDDADIADALNLVAPIGVVRLPDDEVVVDDATPPRPRLVAVPDAAEDATSGSSETTATTESADAAADEAVSSTSSTETTIAIPANHPARSGRATTASTRTRRAKAKTTGDGAPTSHEAGEPDVSDGSSANAPAPTPAARKPRTRKSRASVPTWDEILFGSTKPTDDGA